MLIIFEGWDPVDKQPVRGQLEGVDRAQTQAADLVTVQLQHGSAVTLKQNPTALAGKNIRVGACTWDGAYVLSAYLDSQPAGSFAGLRCVELGAGMGLVGLVLARLGAAVYLTDKPSIVVHSRVNAARNKLLAAPTPAATATTAAAAISIVAISTAVAAAAEQLVERPTCTAEAGANMQSCSNLVNSQTQGTAEQQQQQHTPMPAPAATTVSNAAAGSAAAQAPAAGNVAVLPLNWEDPQSIAAAAASITAQGPIDLIVGTDCIYPDPNGTVPSSSAFMAAVAALATPGHTRVLLTFETRSDELRKMLLAAARHVPGGCHVQQLEADVLPEAYRTTHIELYKLWL